MRWVAGLFASCLFVNAAADGGALGETSKSKRGVSTPSSSADLSGPWKITTQGGPQPVCSFLQKARRTRPTKKIYPPFTRARSWYRPGGPRLAQL